MQNRIETVDLIKVLAIISVIAIHSRPFDIPGSDKQSLYNYLEILINQVGRFAVPFFFIISGYFYGTKVAENKDWSVAKERMIRILSLFLFWCLIYCLPYNVGSLIDGGLSAPFIEAKNNLLSIISRPVDLMFEGTKVHLWFLNALILAILITHVFVRYFNPVILAVLAGSLYIFGVLAGSYSQTSIGIDINFNTRNGPFFAVPLFATGYFLSKSNPKTNWLYWGVSIWGIATLVQIAEVYYNFKTYDIYAGQDYVFATYFMGIGATMVALSNHPVLHIKSMSYIGKRVLGIYAIHLMFCDILSAFDSRAHHPVWEAGKVFIIFGLSITAVLLLERIKPLRKFLS